MGQLLYGHELQPSVSVFVLRVSTTSSSSTGCSSSNGSFSPQVRSETCHHSGSAHCLRVDQWGICWLKICWKGGQNAGRLLVRRVLLLPFYDSVHISHC